MEVILADNPTSRTGRVFSGVLSVIRAIEGKGLHYAAA
jgi:hypothetical protein